MAREAQQGMAPGGHPSQGGGLAAAHPRIEAPVRVLYIGGTGRTGSTLLDRILGQLPDIASVGELAHLWRRSLLENQLCGCGASFGLCPSWSKIGRHAFGGWETLEPGALLRLQRSVDRNRFIPLMERPYLWPPYRRRLEEYGRYLTALYRGIRAATGSPVIVDSTKHNSYAFLLASLPSIELRVIHLIRDSRGVAYSWTKRVRKPEIQDREEYMPTYHPARAGVRWVTYNGMFHRLRHRGVPTLPVRYEELVARPQQEIARIVEFAGFRSTEVDLGFIGPDHVDLQPGHSVAGNPMRFHRGQVPLRRDEEWKVKMPPGQRALVRAITWPLLRRYGYFREGGR